MLPDRNSSLWFYAVVFNMLWAIIFIVALSWATTFSSDHTLLLAENVVFLVIAMCIVIPSSLYARP